MDPQRKRQVRLVVALSVAVLLAVALIYTSFTASTQAKEPTELLDAAPGTSYEMSGRVVPKSVQRRGNALTFEVEDRDGHGQSLPVTYTGTVDPTAVLLYSSGAPTGTLAPYLNLTVDVGAPLE